MVELYTMDRSIKEIIKAAYDLFPSQNLDEVFKYEISYNPDLRRVCLTTDGKNFTYLSRILLDWSDTVEYLIIDHMVNSVNINENYKIIRGEKCVEYYRKTRIYSCMTGQKSIYSRPLFNNDNIFMVVNNYQRAKCYVNEDGTIHLSRVYSNRDRDYLGMAMWLQSKGFTVRQSPYHCHCIINHKAGDFLPYLDKLEVERINDNQLLITGKRKTSAYYTDGFDPTVRDKYAYFRRIVTDNGIENVYSNSFKTYIHVNDALTYVDADYCVVARIGKTRKWCLKKDAFLVKDFGEEWRKDKLVTLNFHYEDEMYPKIYSVKTKNGWIKAKDCIVLDKKYHKKDLIKLSEKYYSGRARAENCSLLNGEIIRLKDYNKLVKKEMMNELVFI